MKRNTPLALLIVTTLSLTACEQEGTAPTAAPASTAPGGVAEAVTAGPVVEEGTCPCWTSRSLGAAFPAASFWFTDLAAEDEAGRAALQLSDIANARVLQALVEFDPHTTTEGSNWCQIATFGQSGLERESISALKISAEEFGACVTVLRNQAAANGFAAD